MVCRRMQTYADVCWYADICCRILTLESDLRRLLLAHAESLLSENEGGSDAGEEQRGSSGSELPVPAAQVC